MRDSIYPGLTPIWESVAVDRSKLKVCIVTPDMKGPLFGGGIGTAYYYLAFFLKRWGHDVSILYTLGKQTLKGSIGEWENFFSNSGINFVALPDDLVPISNGKMGNYLKTQVNVYEWLKHFDFDLVHTPEWRAHAYFCLVAKKLGIAFGNTLFCVGTHSPTLWNIKGNSRLITEEVDLVDSYMERKCVEMADIVVSPSQYMYTWMKGHGFVLPKNRCFVQPNLIKRKNKSEEDLDRKIQYSQKIESIVFFGRFDARKGLFVFCKALEQIETSLLNAIKVFFVGRHSFHFNSMGYIKNQSKKWCFKYQVIDNLNTEQAFDLFKREKCLVVLPSLIDNSPYTVLECIVNRVPFIASNVGGITELVRSDHINLITFPPHPRKLAFKIGSALKMNAFCPALSFDLSQNEYIWKNWHKTIKLAFNNGPFMSNCFSPAYETFDQNLGPKVSVCIAHYNRGRMLLQAIDSLKKQDYPNFEVIIVDDGSDEKKSIEILDMLQVDFIRRGWKIVMQKNKYPGAARNNAVRYSSGEYLLFMDDDNVAMPDEIRKLMAIARFSKADALTSFRMRFTGKDAPNAKNMSYLIPAVGGAVAVGVLFNCFGDTNCLIKRNVFDEIGGFSEDFGLGKEDEEFLANIVVSGFKLMIIPEALYFYRGAVSKIRTKHLDNLGYEQHFAGDLRALRPYFKSVPSEMADLLYLVRGLNIKKNTAFRNILLQRCLQSSLARKSALFIPNTIKTYIQSKFVSFIKK